MKEKLSPIILIGLTALITFFITKSCIESRKEIVQSPSRIDTIQLGADTVFVSKINQVKLPGQIDTIYLADTIQSIVARADTVLWQDSSYIRVSYFFPPENHFDLEMQLKEKLITVTREILRYIPVQQPWWDHFWLGAVSVGAAVLITLIKII